MFSVPAILVAITLYFGVLMLAGWRIDRMRARRSARGLQPVVYGLSLATLCSAWTYFGAVGDASDGSWLYIANAIGPILAVTVGYPVWRRIAQLCRQENVGSLADFLAARYGKSRALGILTACVACLGALPYIALQIAILARVASFATGAAVPGGSLALVLVLAAMAMLFGARRPGLTQQARGFVGIIAIEACVKLIGLLSVAGLGIALFARAPNGLTMAIHALPPLPTGQGMPFVTLVLLCTVTAFTLPRQFHLGFVTLERVEDIRGAPWVVSVYFGLWAVATLVVALAIRAGFGIAGADPYMQVLAVPMRHGGQVLALLALLGGLSAGAAMVIVETTAISAMVANEIVLPLFAHTLRPRRASADIGGTILRVRRGTILAIALLAWLYDRGIAGAESPTRLGLTALTAFAQLLPALLGGIWWRGGHARGAIAGICAGMAVWAGAIAAPAFLSHGPGGSEVLWFGSGTPGASLAVYASLLANVVLYVLVSLRATPRLIDTIQANSFVARNTVSAGSNTAPIAATLADVRQLLARFLGAEEADRAVFDLQFGTRGGPLADDDPVSPHLVRGAERVLAGVIGAPSARNVMALALAAGSQDARDISRILDEAGHAVHFSRELLQTTLDSLPQGVGVIDPELRLVTWNARFVQLLGLPVGDLHVGRPLDELLGDDGHELRDHIAARLRTGPAGTEEIPLADGRNLSVRDLPLAGGDRLLTIADITDLRQAERVLARSNEELEALVADRTHALMDANAALDAARQEAERATRAQERFVAAASHDLVQPLHAARLFIGNALIGRDADAAQQTLLHRADQAVEGAHHLLKALLNLSQLEIGALTPRLEPVDAGALLRSLEEEFTAQANARGLALVVLPTHAWVRSDRDLLRSMLQNLMLNALRYTRRGRIVVAVRRAGANWRFEVRDSGVGIPPDKLPAAFGAFSRLAEGRAMAEGSGLGLAIVARIADVLGHDLAVRSRPGAGSVFSIAVAAATPRPVVVRTMPPALDLKGLRVLCVDDESDVLFATAALIRRWGGMVSAHEAAAAALAADGPWDAVMADYALAGGNGLDLLRQFAGPVTLRLLVTATPDHPDLREVAAEGIVLLAKPLAPLALSALLSEAAGQRNVPAPLA